MPQSHSYLRLLATASLTRHCERVAPGGLWNARLIVGYNFRLSSSTVLSLLALFVLQEFAGRAQISGSEAGRLTALLCMDALTGSVIRQRAVLMVGFIAPRSAWTRKCVCTSVAVFLTELPGSFLKNKKSSLSEAGDLSDIGEPVSTLWT